jgi:hypothetical protein
LKDLAFASLHMWDPERISAEPQKFTRDVTVRKLPDYNLFIEIPK